MWGFSRVCAGVMCVTLSAATRFAVAQDQDRTVSLVLQFSETRNVADKEKILYRITQRGQEAGPLLLQLARSTGDTDTRWLAIRGLGTLKFAGAAPFLIESLKSEEHYVRANAARALGELQYSPASPALLRQLEVEQDAGVIGQTSVALVMIKVPEAIPMLKARMSFNSTQTQCWLLDAIACLGSKRDGPYIAGILYGSDSSGTGVPFCAISALATLTGEDFGLPRASGLFDSHAPVIKAQGWWERTQKEQTQ
jgi:HEAT repeat protein